MIRDGVGRGGARGQLFTQKWPIFSENIKISKKISTMENLFSQLLIFGFEDFPEEKYYVCTP